MARSVVEAFFVDGGLLLDVDVAEAEPPPLPPAPVGVVDDALVLLAFVDAAAAAAAAAAAVLFLLEDMLLLCCSPQKYIPRIYSAVFRLCAHVEFSVRDTATRPSLLFTFFRPSH